MLALAYKYQEELNSKMLEIAFNDKYKYYNNGIYWDYTKPIENDSWNKLQFVSIDKNDNILGYLEATIGRTNELISGLAIINFYDTNITFSKDLYEFLTSLFEKHNFRKIEFEVVQGNPIEKMYDRCVRKYGGRIVGILNQHVKLSDNNYYNLKMYEIFKVDYDNM